MANIMGGLTGAGAGASLGAKAGTLFGPAGTLVGGVIGGIGGALAGLFGKRSQSPQEKALQEILKEYDAMGIPPVDALQLSYDKMKQQGLLTPEIESAIQQDSTQLKSIQTDPALKDAQREALVRMQQEGRSGGMQLEDRAAVEQALQTASAQNRGEQGAILSNMAERGMGGSGAELAARLSSAQNAANQTRQSGLQTAADARKRALQAIATSGDMAGTQRTQDFNEQKAIADAQDAINRFNASNAQGVQTRNTTAVNNAQASNLQEAQRIADNNVILSNQQKQQHAQALVDNYNRQKDYLGGKANLLNGQANATATANANNGAGVAGILKGAGDLLDKGVTSFDKLKTTLNKDKEPDLTAGQPKTSTSDNDEDPFGSYV